MIGTDVLIIGGGIAGASLGYALARPQDAVLLEAEDQPGYHSTGRSAALYMTTYGHPLIRALTHASRAFLERPPAGFAEVALMQLRGVLWIARADQQAAFARYYADCSALDRSVARCTVEQALALCPALQSAYVNQAFVEPSAQDMDVSALHQGYLRGFRARGGRLITRARVGSIERSAAGWTVHAGAEQYRARVLVNAGGAWADGIAQLAGLAPVGLTPKQRTAITFNLPAGLDASRWPCVLDVEEQFYFKPDAGRMLASPADETPVAPADAQADDFDVAVTADRIEQATTLQVQRIASRWAGLRTFARDKIPVVGADPAAENFFWLAGQGGYGIMTSPALGQLSAALIEQRELPASLREHGIDVAALSPARFTAPAAV